VKCLFLQGKRSKVIHAELSEVHEEAAVGLATVKRWCWGFKDGNFSLDDEFRSGRPRDDIGEAISQFLNKEPSLLHGFSHRGLYEARTQSKRFSHTIWEWENSHEDWCPMSSALERRQNESLMRGCCHRHRERSKAGTSRISWLETRADSIPIMTRRQWWDRREIKSFQERDRR
jgi:hypothetical protein